MKWVAVLGITLGVAAITQWEWSKLRHLRKEKLAFAVLVMMGYILAVLLVYFPELPGPTQVLSAFLKPIEKMMGSS